MTDKEILSMDNVPVAIAAAYLGMNKDALRNAVKQGRVPFGFAYQGDGGRWAIHISPGGLVHYKREGIVFALKKEASI